MTVAELITLLGTVPADLEVVVSVEADCVREMVTGLMCIDLDHDKGPRIVLSTEGS